MIERGIGKYIYDMVFGTTQDECAELKTKWFIHCFQQPIVAQKAFIWPALGDNKIQFCKQMFDDFERCKNNLKK